MCQIFRLKSVLDSIEMHPIALEDHADKMLLKEGTDCYHGSRFPPTKLISALERLLDRMMRKERRLAVLLDREKEWAFSRELEVR